MLTNNARPIARSRPPTACLPRILATLLGLCSLAYAEQPQRVSLCDLNQNPAAFNRRLVEIAGFLSHGFENFTLFDPSCPSGSTLWLEYGGTIASGTVYCCGPSPDRTRPGPLTVEDTPIPLTVDRPFQDLDRLLQQEPDRTVRATIVGRFFAGQRHTLPDGSIAWGGYGHLGCCSLLAIQQVLSVDPQNRKDLDYRASVDHPDTGKPPCSYRNFVPPDAAAAHLAAQRDADAGPGDAPFTNPQQVAANSLAEFLDVKPAAITRLKTAKRSNGRIEYRWKPERSRQTYLVVVSRPYWLSFCAKQPDRIAWVTIAAYESSCR